MNALSCLIYSNTNVNVNEKHIFFFFNSKYESFVKRDKATKLQRVTSIGGK